MISRRALSLYAMSVSLIISTLMCTIGKSPQEEARLDAQAKTSIAEEATRFSRNVTETAQASITPSVTPSVAPSAAPTSTQTPTKAPDRPNYTFDSSNLPQALFSVTDPSDDAYVCIDGASVNDQAVDIMSIMIFDPQTLGVTHQYLMTRVELGVPGNTTFANDWSGSVVVAFAPHGASAYTVTVNENHAGQRTQGTLDESGQAILPDTAHNTFIDDQGNFWFMIPADSTFLQVASFHMPTEDLPPEQKRCDLAPNHDAYTLDLP